MGKLGGPKMLLKVDCLPNDVGKQLSIPLIYLGAHSDNKLMMMMMMMMMIKIIKVGKSVRG